MIRGLQPGERIRLYVPEVPIDPPSLGIRCWSCLGGGSNVGRDSELLRLGCVETSPIIRLSSSFSFSNRASSISLSRACSAANTEVHGSRSSSSSTRVVDGSASSPPRERRNWRRRCEIRPIDSDTAVLRVRSCTEVSSCLARSFVSYSRINDSSRSCTSCWMNNHRM